MNQVSAARKAAKAVNIRDLRTMAQRRLPGVVFDYLDGGAEDEVTLRENCRVFCDITFRPRHAVSFPQCNLRTRVFGCDLALPFLLAPVGYSRLMHPSGEIAAARAAGAAGTAYILSTISGHALEKVKAASTGPVCYQLYLMGGRQAAEAAIQRARDAGFAALAVTIDTPVAGLRERDFRNGMKEILGDSWFDKIPYVAQVLAHPAVGGELSGGRRRAAACKRRCAWRGSDVAHGCRFRTRAFRGDLGGFQVDSRALGRPDYCQKCANG